MPAQGTMQGRACPDGARRPERAADQALRTYDTGRVLVSRAVQPAREVDAEPGRGEGRGRLTQAGFLEEEARALSPGG